MGVNFVTFLCKICHNIVKEYIFQNQNNFSPAEKFSFTSPCGSEGISETKPA